MLLPSFLGLYVHCICFCSSIKCKDSDNFSLEFRAKVMKNVHIFGGILHLVNVMANQNLHSLSPEKNVFCRYCVTNQAGPSIATHHWIRFSRKQISFWILLKACIQPPNAILKEIEFTLELFLWRISQAEIMRRQDQVQDLVRSQEPQSWNILEVGNELSLKR